jgi:hypothetical protein
MAIERLLTTGNLEEALYIFARAYREEIPEELDTLYEPKTLENGLRGLEAYFRHYSTDKYDYEVLHVEIGGIVLLGENMPIHVRLDAILRDVKSGKIFLRDEKTAQRKSAHWLNEYLQSLQIMTYLHVLYCLENPESILGAKIRKNFFYKAQPNVFEEGTIEKTPEKMEDFLYSAQTWYWRLLMDVEYLKNCKDSDVILRCFPKNTESCTKYYGCAFLDFCEAWPNPLRRADIVPLGFKQEFFDPRDLPLKEEISIGNV